MDNARRVCSFIPTIVIALSGLAPATPIAPTPRPVLTETSVLAKTIDLARYYPSRLVAQHELQALERETGAFPKQAPTTDIGAYLKSADRLIGRGRRLHVYFTILAARDIDDHAASTAIERTDATRDTVQGQGQCCAATCTGSRVDRRRLRRPGVPLSR